MIPNHDPWSYIKFQNIIFRRGLMQTTRRGTKWHAGEGFVKILDRHDNEWGKGLWIVHTHTYKFNQIPVEEIAMNHDLTCQSYDGLKKAMKSFYPDFKEDEVVTLVYFRLAGD